MTTADRRYALAVGIAWLLICIAITLRVLSDDRRTGLSSWELALALVVVVALGGAVLTTFAVAIPLRIIVNLALKQRRRSHRSETIALAVVWILFFGYFFETRREKNRLAPPSGIQTLSEFARVMPPPRGLSVVQSEDTEYIAWSGEYSGPLDLPSGPSCYLFNRQGDLVEWEPVTGEGTHVDEILSRQSKSESISLIQALKMVGSSDSESDGDARH